LSLTATIGFAEIIDERLQRKAHVPTTGIVEKQAVDRRACPFCEYSDQPTRGELRGNICKRNLNEARPIDCGPDGDRELTGRQLS